MRMTMTWITALGLSTVFAHGDELRFRKTVLSTTFVSEGCAVGDFNKDGRMDVVAGPYWYAQPPKDGPNQWKAHELREPGRFNWDGGYSKSFVNGVSDVNLDGWDDVIIVGFPNEATIWYENPKELGKPWPAHEIAVWSCNESPQIVDLNRDGHLDLVMGYTPPTEELGWMVWCAGPSDARNLRWELHPISKAKSPGTHRFWHGLGVGDMNKDGRKDIIIRQGWWEAPENPKSTDWTFHPAALGDDCADMYAYDVDDDGDMDVISCSAHKYGLWWHEQGQDAEGKATWKTHTIYDKFSQSHALQFADMNGDGLPDLITGKRFWAHNGHDPGEKEPAVLYWFEFSRKDGKPNWTPHLVDDDSGIGTQFVVVDINGDKRPDIVTSNKKGTFVLENLGAGK